MDETTIKRWNNIILYWWWYKTYMLCLRNSRFIAQPGFWAHLWQCFAVPICENIIDRIFHSNKLFFHMLRYITFHYFTSDNLNSRLELRVAMRRGCHWHSFGISLFEWCWRQKVEIHCEILMWIKNVELELILRMSGVWCFAVFEIIDLINISFKK